jgi:hypothetical protein
LEIQLIYRKLLSKRKFSWVTTCSHLGQVYAELVRVRGIPRFKVNPGN